MVFSVGCSNSNEPDKIKYSNEELYRMAVINSMTINEKDILPLIKITTESQMCSWNADGKVLMLTHHSFPNSYIAGEEYTLIYGKVWTFTDKEILKWYAENKNNVTCWELRFKQLLGLPENRTYTHFSAMWTNPADILRPGYAWQLSDTVGAAFFEVQPTSEYKEWFDKNIVWSYFESAYPWTRLGYTYDWSYSNKVYGLSEFIIQKNSTVFVEWTFTTQEFLQWLEDNGE